MKLGPGVRARISQLWVLTHGLIKVRDGVLTQRDVKNEGTSGDMYENKGEHDKTSGEKHGFLHLASSENSDPLNSRNSEPLVKREKG